MDSRNLRDNAYYSHPNSSNTTEKPDLDFSAYFTRGVLPLRILMVAVSALAVLLNAILLIVTSKVKSKRKHYFCLVKSLSSADLLMSLLYTIYPITSAFEVRDNRSGFAYYITKSINNVLHISATCAVAVNLIIIAVDSYIALIYPLRYTTFVTGRKIHVLVIFVWLFSLLCGSSCFFSAAIQKIFYYPTSDYFWLAAMCRVTARSYNLSILLIVVSLVQSTCVLVLLVIYTRICVEICKQHRFEREQARMRSQGDKQGNKGVLTSFFVIGSYLILAFPYELYMALVLNMNLQAIHLLRDILIIFKFVNCLCDPIIYAFRLTEVRNTIKRIFTSN